MSPLTREEVHLIFKWLEVVRSLPPPDYFKPSENQTRKKWKRVFTLPPRETQAGEYEVIVPASPPRVGVKWRVHISRDWQNVDLQYYRRSCYVWN